MLTPITLRSGLVEADLPASLTGDFDPDLVDLGAALESSLFLATGTCLVCAFFGFLGTA